MRVAHVNMSQDGASCPQGLTQKNMSGLTLCGQNAAGCEGTLFSTLGLSYSRVCGRLRGYQFGTTDAFHSYDVDVLSLDPYVDGVSITSGIKHIWTYATGNHDGAETYDCPCNTGASIQVPTDVGSDYYCESGNSDTSSSTELLYSDDPLWDGEQCDGEEAPCCTHPNLPWFIKTLCETTTEDSQLRLCIDEQPTSEETLLQLIMLFVFLSIHTFTLSMLTFFLYFAEMNKSRL